VLRQNAFPPLAKRILLEKQNIQIRFRSTLGLYKLNLQLSQSILFYVQSKFTKLSFSIHSQVANNTLQLIENEFQMIESLLRHPLVFHEPLMIPALDVASVSKSSVLRSYYYVLLV
jgi:hypothetical protein